MYREIKKKRGRAPFSTHRTRARGVSKRLMTTPDLQMRTPRPEDRRTQPGLVTPGAGRRTGRGDGPSLCAPLPPRHRGELGLEGGREGARPLKRRKQAQPGKSARTHPRSHSPLPLTPVLPVVP